MTKNIAWQNNADYWRMPFHKNGKTFDAIVLVEWNKPEKKGYEALSIGRFSKGGVFIDGCLADFQFGDFEAEIDGNIKRWALIDFKYC